MVVSSQSKECFKRQSCFTAALPEASSLVAHCYRAPMRNGRAQRWLVARTRYERSTGDVSFYPVMKPAENRQVSSVVFHIVRYQTLALVHSPKRSIVTHYDTSG